MLMSYKRSLIWLILGFFVFSFAAMFGVMSIFLFQVYFGDDSYLKKSTILAKINEETTIYYVDETTRLGSFFEQQHRRYVPIDEVPAHMINALIASEDKFFYEHNGINPIAIFKAIGEGIQVMLTSGQMHFRGGSTITQQTVKNILDRKEYSIKRKFREAIAAMQLERLYTKREILEFYFNQFHVASNGNGIGIAAKYYFNKEVFDLNLVEAAFIAGSVKGPSKYNPFIQYTPEAKTLAWQYANERKNYVLRQMYEQNWITEEEFKEAWDKPVPFNKGKFTTREVALVSLIRSQMNRKEILEAVGIENIEDLNHSGFRIITTLDSDIQQAAQLMMRRNLSRLETILQGYKPEPKESFKSIRDLEVGEFYYGRVEKVISKPGQAEVLIDFGLPKGVINNDSLVRYAKLLDIAVPTGYQQRLKDMLKQMKVGDVVFVEVREYNRETHQAVLELQKRPIVNGAIIVVEKGEMRAVVSGFDPQGYNRAIFGKRQPGSVFKAVSYFAALQLGWTILDQLDNERRLFPYQGQFYYPRPDHDSPYDDVSMIWAGTKSENLGSIFLTSRLVEKLDLDQFKAIMGVLGLLPNPGENKRDFHYRVARKIGVQLDNEGVREFELQNAVNDVSTDLVFSGDHETNRQIQKMWWGRGYAAELQRLYLSNDEDVSDKERLLRISLVKNNYQRFLALGQFLESDWARIREVIDINGPESVFSTPELKEIISHFRVIPGRGNKPALGYFRNLVDEVPRSSGVATVVIDPTPGRSLNGLDIQSIWGSANSMFASSANINLEDVKLNGYLTLNLFKKLQARLDQRYSAVMAIQEPYDLPQYYHHHDFRVAIGLNYLKKLVEQMGVFSDIEPVLSFPLGTNVVSVAEVAKIYQTFTEGKIYRFYKEGPANQLNFIKRIEDREGNVLYEPQYVEHELVNPVLADEMQQILRKVVTHGTGSRARGELFVKLTTDEKTKKFVPIRIPAFGKTGTTNDYTTASFAGFVPYPVEKNAPLKVDNSYVLASYVGYDDNKQMLRGGYKVGGAQGALPVWTDLAKDIIDKKKYIDYLDKLDLNLIAKQEWPLRFDKKTVPIKVDLARGVILRQDEGVGDEMFATTDIGSTGEEFVNEFALNASVRSVVRLPVDLREGSGSPLRAVLPMNVFKTEEQIAAEKKAGTFQDASASSVSSRVDPNAVKQLSAPDEYSNQRQNNPTIVVVPNNDRSIGPDTTVVRPPQPSPISVSGIEASSKKEAPRAAPNTDDLLKQIEAQQEQKKKAQPSPASESNSGYQEEELW